MKSLVFDIETDGLQPTKIFCISAFDVDTEEQFNFSPFYIEDGIALLEGADKLIGHNIIGFDKSIPKFIDTSSEEAKFPSVIISKDRRPTL